MLEPQTSLHQMTELNVYSETGRLRRVLLHHPREEIERMTPSNSAALLFDDILFLPEAQAEHRAFEEMLQALGIEVLRTEGLLVEALRHLAESQGVEAVIRQVRTQQESIAAGYPYGWPSEYGTRLEAHLMGLWHDEEDISALARALIEGVLATERMDFFSEKVAPFLLPPIPNLLFMRDCSPVVGDRVLISSLARAARKRESLLMRLIFQQARRLQGDEGRELLLFDPYEQPIEQLAQAAISIEGGDVLIPHEAVLLLGLSERTTPAAFDRLVELLLRGESGIEVIFAVMMPKQRATIHLDTVFTMTSEEECLVYPSMVLEGGLEQMPVVRASRDKEGNIVLEEQPSLLRGLEAELRRRSGNEGYRLNPIFCGGPNFINQNREQWTDGANGLALASGVVVGYDRNYHTFEALRAAGYSLVRAEEVIRDSTLAGEIRASMDHSIPGADYRPTRRKYAIAIPGAELSRARGGPRCMSMPLLREPVRWGRA